MQILKRFLKNENGSTAIEYGLIAALVAVAILGAITSTGSNVNILHNEIGDRVGNAMKNAGK